MRKLTQTRLHNPPESTGNCFPTVLACLMDKDSPEDVIQIQEYYKNNEDWYDILLDYLEVEGYTIRGCGEHQYDDSYYMVSGNTERGTYHITIYKNGKLYHDPHYSRAGLINEKEFDKLVKI